ncbi:hypothetical protein [Streptomyces lydicus]|uniref:hypothetical protein n=1 Tax=Streptomyces lydicus TaxID=47763 RepID=UPI0036F7552A
MRITRKAMGASAAALVLTAFLPATAHAATVQPSCGTTGAQGNLRVENFHRGVKHINVSMTVYDSLADGYSAGIRLITLPGNDVNYWPWHINKDGKGTLKTWNTSANDNRGFTRIGVMIGRFKGDDFITCTEWA